MTSKIVNSNDISKIGISEGFMPDKYYNRIAREDGYLYVYDFDKKKWKKMLDVDSRDVPDSVKKSIREDIIKGQEDVNLLKTIEV